MEKTDMTFKATRKVLIHAATATALALTAPLAGAVDVGLGVTINNEGGGSGGYGVSLPLRFGNFTVEPELSFYDSSDDTTYPTSPTNTSAQEYQQYTLETGVYWRQPIIPSVEMYVGGRVGYTRYEQSSTYPSSPGSNYAYDSSGFYLGPTLGAEYFFNKHFSLGLDVSLLFESTTQKSTGGSPYTQDRDSIDYQSRAKLRFYF
jgi:hypothetical protein